MRNVINEYLSQFDLDVRKSHDARFVDQKCTPDIVCFMADCVMNMVATKPVFVINDVWETQYFIRIQELFSISRGLMTRKPITNTIRCFLNP